MEQEKEGEAGGKHCRGGSRGSRPWWPWQRCPLSPPHVRRTRSTTSVLALADPTETSQSSFLAWSFQEKELVRFTWRPTLLVSSWTLPDTSDTRGS